MKQLQQWLREKCAERNLSWREASIGSGLNPGAISAIVGGQRPGLDSCKALAKFFRVSPILILQLAGHIEESALPNNPSLLDPVLQEFIRLWPEIPPPVRENMLNIITISLKLKREKRGE